MKKLSHKLLTVLFGFLIGIFFSFFAYSLNEGILLSGSYGDSHTIGTFLTGGNAGIISFDDAPPGYSGAQVIGLGSSEVYMTGIFWMQTVGWSTFGEYPVKLIPPNDGENVRSPWYLSGYVWTVNAGWIALNHGEVYASGVVFHPDTGKLTGYGFSDTIGWVPFGEYTASTETGTVSTGTGISSSSGVAVEINQGFIGKVDVSGSIGGDKTFNVLYEVGGTFNSASMTSFVNVVRRNAALLIRNAGSFVNKNLDGASAVSFGRSMIFKSDDNDIGEFVTYGNIENTFNIDQSRSLIVVGADIYIDIDVLPPPLLNQSRAIIALQNEKGQGGSIWVKGNVQTIEATLFAEKTIWSGEEFSEGVLSPYYVSKKSLFLDIPRYQLYIKGGVAGHNTIGGGSKDGGAICPYVSELEELGEICNYDSAIKYDWNYFRIYSGNPARRSYYNNTKDDYSVVIEYDPRVLQDPPPGLETKK